MRRLSVFAMPLLLIAAACTGGPAATPTAAPPTQAPATQPVTPAPPTTGPAADAPATATPVGVSGNECAAVPTFSLATPQPSFPADEALKAAFPEQIAGQPVTNVTTFSFAALICMFGGQAAMDQFKTELQGDLDLSLLSMGTAKMSIDDESVDLLAFRLPGSSGSQIIASYAQLAAVAAGKSGEEPANLTTQTVGGKSVTVVTAQDGEVSYLYPAGEILWVVSDVTSDQAATILAALP